jgi:uncharacterized protein (UPF0276 family)
MDYLNAIKPEWVQQIHLAGHSDMGTHIVDTHDHPVPDPVWALYEEYAKICGPKSTMIERDDNIPSMEELVEELQQARDIGDRVWSTEKRAVHA